MANNQTFDSIVKANSSVALDWYDGYKLELTFTAESNASNWQLDFELPYEIKEVYGVDLVNHGDGRYTVSGEGNQTNLSQGQSINSVFIIKDDNKDYKEAVLPKFNSSTASYSQPVDVIASESQPTNIIATEPENGGKIISVDNDHYGNLQSAIAAANNGDVVQLGNNTYYTSDIYLDKDITINGQSGSVIDGQGSSNAVINIASGASGATIQNLEITNANNGIYSNRAYNLTLQNLDINNIGNNEVIRYGQNNTGITANHANGLQLLDSTIENMGRSGINVGDTEGAIISGITVKDVNLKAEHAQSHDAAGIKFFNTNNITLKDSYFSDINANHIWNDTTTNTTIEGNVIERVGEDFLAPQFNTNVDITGIYNEKSHNSVVKNNEANAVGRFTTFRATEFTTETMTLENNDFPNMELGSTDYWVNESVEKLIAITENPGEADFSLFKDEYNAQANIG